MIDLAQARLALIARHQKELQTLDNALALIQTLHQPEVPTAVTFPPMRLDCTPTATKFPFVLPCEIPARGAGGLRNACRRAIPKLRETWNIGDLRAQIAADEPDIKLGQLGACLIGLTTYNEIIRLPKTEGEITRYRMGRIKTPADPAAKPAKTAKPPIDFSLILALAQSIAEPFTTPDLMAAFKAAHPKIEFNPKMVYDAMDRWKKRGWIIPSETRKHGYTRSADFGQTSTRSAKERAWAAERAAMNIKLPEIGDTEPKED